MIRDYSDLLPSYLDGENIRKHSSLIERSDKYLDGLVELFSLWNKLERPILIKREQTKDNGQQKVTLHVNTPTPIQEIILEGDIEKTITPPDSVTTSYEKTWTINNPSIEVYTQTGVVNTIKMPIVTVTVRTETHTYTKAYPENDTIQNNDADHDIFLDIIGGLLGIPRRQYTEVNIPGPFYPELARTTPPYMAKEVQTTSTGITILPCSEDDYYYKERLDYFINTTDNLRLFRTIYDKEAVILKKEDNIIPSELVGTETTVLFTHIQKGAIRTRNNLNIDTTNIQQIAEQTLPITRPVQIYPYATIQNYYNSTTKEQYVNRYKLHLTLGLDAKTIDAPSGSYEAPIANLPVNITYEDGTEVGTFITDETGTAHISIDGARSGQQALKWDLTREYPYFNRIWGIINYDASLFKLSLDDDAWQYKKLADTTVTGFEPASMLGNNNLNCGTGMIAYTPAINPQLVDLTNYNIHIVFHHTNNGQQIRMGTLQETEETAQLMNVLTVRPRQYETENQPITATHTVDFKFTNGVCHAYFDGTDTGLSKDYSNITDILYIGGYNSTSNSETKGLHFEEISVGDDTRVITELSCTTLNSTTGSAGVKATLTSNGTGLSGATIECSNGTTLITSSTTDTNGECTLNLSTLQAGSYTLTIEYDGDTTHSPSTATHNITITDPTTLNLYGKGQTTGWSTTQWTTIEINAAEEAHCNYTKRNAILKNLPLSGDFTLILHIQASHNTTWNWGLIPSQSDYSNPAMKVSKGDTLNTNTSIATMFDHGSGVWDTTVPVTVTRSGTTYTLEYNGNSYSFTGSTDTLYLWMDKTGSGNLFLTYIETTAIMQ